MVEVAILPLLLSKRRTICFPSHMAFAAAISGATKDSKEETAGQSTEGF
jgi:hypothetical protein